MALSRIAITLSILLTLKWVIGIPVIVNRDIDDYWSKRANFIREEESVAFGGDVPLQKNEFLMNYTLMSAKFMEIDEGFADQGKFLPRSNFLRVKNEIEKSKVFQIIKKMPKGAILHAHDLGLLSLNYVLTNVTYRDNLYACEKNGQLKLMFFKQPNKDCKWKLLSKLRQNSTKASEINKRIQRQMSMVTKHPKYPDGDKAWIKFQSIFEFLFPFLTYKPVFEDYYYHCLQEIYDDKVLYLELRTILPDLFDLDGRVYKKSEVMQILKDVTDRFTATHQDFIGAKIIYAPTRRVDLNQLKEYLENARQLKKDFPSFLAGFDLVGQEDKGGLLIDFADQLQILGKDIPFFFHAGETDWYGLSTDQNLIDAILLNTKRIGHGYALLKHPKVMELVKEKNIAIEINPISNQVLSLVGDMRNHPATFLFAENYPVVVSCDDPGLWGARALSYDFYEAFMGLMARSSDLRALKKLALNSIAFSMMTDDEKSSAFLSFEKQWQQFLQVSENGHVYEL
ncbi:adenosine deaminase 2-like [Leptopilina heterotoma]|uniref:adenosine deaminase 2-like n=1 Tax=Leptopilina heterotoma TaxID=63436 RepID=UPI001CA832DB|nr:adenosine deaminase 2-like [Leptopilina heterotoma]